MSEERGCRGQPSTRPSPSRAALQLAGHRSVRPRGGLRPVPRPPVGVQFLIRGLGENAVRFPSLAVGGAPVSGGTSEGMAEPHACAELDNLGIDVCCRVGSDVQA
ncbi:hypothetical protein ACN6LL_004375, partial [Streptomyces violaceoruber]